MLVASQGEREIMSGVPVAACQLPNQGVSMSEEEGEGQGRIRAQGVNPRAC
jgi:hypothetical protein